jgi:hypothetical protein
MVRHVLSFKYHVVVLSRKKILYLQSPTSFRQWQISVAYNPEDSIQSLIYKNSMISLRRRLPVFLSSLVVSFLLFPAEAFRADTASVFRHRQYQYSTFSPRCHYVAISAQVNDMDDWVRLSSESLQKLTGVSMLDRMEGVETVSQVHSNERYSVLAHDTEDDPVYCYFNAGAFLTYEYPPQEIYELPSRYSAPDGPVRADRQALMQTVVKEGVWTFPTAIRQSKSGHLFQLQDVILWNVYNNDGVRVGQTALFDRQRILPVDQTAP